MPRILETIVTTCNADGSVHLVPFGLIVDNEDYIVAPFRPSPTIGNLERHPFLAAAAPVDIRVVAGCVTGRREWATVPCERIDCVRLDNAFAHMELAVCDVVHDDVRPRFRCRVVHVAMHQPFLGYSRAQAAVLEAAILSTRLHLLSPDKIRSEMAYLQIGVDKTAGEAEREAWRWIEEKVRSGPEVNAAPGGQPAATRP